MDVNDNKKALHSQTQMQIIKNEKMIENDNKKALHSQTQLQLIQKISNGCER